MIRLAVRLPVITLYALLMSCGGGSHEPEPPAAVPAPAVQPQDGPHTPSAPSPKGDSKAAPQDSGGSGNYPWQSGPIAAL